MLCLLLVPLLIGLGIYSIVPRLYWVRLALSYRCKAMLAGNEGKIYIVMPHRTDDMSLACAADILACLPSIYRMDLHSDHFSATGILYLTSLREVREISFKTRTVRPGAIRAIVAIPGLTHLTIRTDDWNRDAVVELGKAQNVTSLVLMGLADGVKSDVSSLLVSTLASMQSLSEVGLGPNILSIDARQQLLEQRPDIHIFDVPGRATPARQQFP